MISQPAVRFGDDQRIVRAQRGTAFLALRDRAISTGRAFTRTEAAVRLRVGPRRIRRHDDNSGHAEKLRRSGYP
jgi:hypothetical protein